VTRLIGTLIGLVLGLGAWYIGECCLVSCRNSYFYITIFPRLIGNGRGEGNPYGAGASVALFIIPIVFIRVYAPQKYLAATALGGVCVAYYDYYCVTFADF
jgi:hypothetical protein